jgi:hypothetical protein
MSKERIRGEGVGNHGLRNRHLGKERLGGSAGQSFFRLVFLDDLFGVQVLWLERRLFDEDVGFRLAAAMAGERFSRK